MLIGQVTGMEDLDQVTYFICGLKPATRIEVNCKQPADVETAIAHAITYDTARFGSDKPVPYQPVYSEQSSNCYDSSSPCPIELDSVEQQRHHKSAFKKLSKNKKKEFACNNHCTFCCQTGHLIQNCTNP